MTPAPRFLLLLAALAGACAPAPPQAPPDDDRPQADYEAELARLSDEIDAAIGEARADTLAQCRILEVGVKPCGGPWEYRVFSLTDGDPEEVLRLTAIYNARNAEMNERFGLVSTCEFVGPPEVALEGGRCIARTP
jgi:hypothetical protein